MTIVKGAIRDLEVEFFRLWTRTPRTTMLSFPAGFGTVVINRPLYNGGSGTWGSPPAG